MMEEGLKSIGSFAFSECLERQSIKIPDSVETIGDNSFDNMNNELEVIMMGKEDLMVGQKRMKYDC